MYYKYNSHNKETISVLEELSDLDPKFKCYEILNILKICMGV